MALRWAVASRGSLLSRSKVAAMGKSVALNGVWVPGAAGKSSRAFVIHSWSCGCSGGRLGKRRGKVKCSRDSPEKWSERLIVVEKVKILVSGEVLVWMAST